jgi:hypothetical protein
MFLPLGRQKVLGRNGIHPSVKQFLYLGFLPLAEQSPRPQEIQLDVTIVDM